MALKPQQRTFRYWLQQLHLWIGLILLLPLVIMGVTGAVLVYAHDIEHLLGQGELTPKTVGDWRSPGELIEAARAATREPGRIPIAVRWPIEVGEPAAVRLARPGMAQERQAFRGGELRCPQGQGSHGQSEALRQRAFQPLAEASCRLHHDSLPARYSAWWTRNPTVDSLRPARAATARS